MKIRLVAILLFAMIQGFITTAYAEDDGMRLYAGGRAIADAMKVTGSDEATKGFKATTMQFGAGMSAGIY